MSLLYNCVSAAPNWPTLFDFKLQRDLQHVQCAHGSSQFTALVQEGETSPLLHDQGIFLLLISLDVPIKI